MKKSIFNICLLSGLLLVACEKETEYVDVVADVPAITVNTSVTVAKDGGVYSFSYSISDPADDGVISCTADVSWMSDFNTATSGTVSFTAAANTGAVRTGNIVLTYRYTEDGSVKSVIERVGVVQYAYTAPTLSVQPNAVTAAAVGGSYSFNYTIGDPDDDGEFSCAASENWVYGFDYDTPGTVNFIVDANESDELRTAAITVTYAYGYEKITKEVTVVQNHPGSVGTSIEDVIGTYNVTGIVNGQGISYAETTWTLKIMKYAGTVGGFDLDIDGIVPWTATYDTYGDNRTSAAAYFLDGQIIIPTQCLGRCKVSTDSGSFYLGFTAVTKYDGSFYYSDPGPSTVLSYDSSTDEWISDYGVFAIGFTDDDELTMSTTYFQAVGPNFTMTRISDSVTSSSVQSGVVPLSVSEHGTALRTE